MVGFSITALRAARPHLVAVAQAAGLATLAAGQVRPPVTVVESLAQVGEVHDLLANRAGSGTYVVRAGGTSGGRVRA